MPNMNGLFELSLSGRRHGVIKQPEKLPNWELWHWRMEQLSKLTMQISIRLIMPSIMLKQDVLRCFLEEKCPNDNYLLWQEVVSENHKKVKLYAKRMPFYKFLYGAGGLCGQPGLIEKPELENYAHLFGKSCINTVQWLGLSSYLLLTFVNRFFIC